MSQQNIIFEDNFKIEEIDKDIKVFEKVSRIEGITEDSSCKIVLDINSDIYHVAKDKIYSILILKNLSEGSAVDDQYFDYNLYLKNNAYMNKYDYITYGKIFKYTEESSNVITIYASFGGLLFSITGNSNQLDGFNMDDRIYLMIKSKSD